MQLISILVRNRVAMAVGGEYVCDNSEYVAKFDFDEEWNAYETKTARFAYNGRMVDVVFDGDECPIPIIQGAFRMFVGVFAGNLYTTTPASVACRGSILGFGGVPAEPPDDVYNQIMDKLNKLDGGDSGGGGNGTIRSVNGIEPDENGNVEIEVGTDIPDEDILDSLNESGFLAVVSDESGIVYTDENGNTLYYL